MKAIRQAQTRDILDAYDREDISYSRMNEMFNELAEQFAIGFTDWISMRCYITKDNSYWLIRNEGDIKKNPEELLQIYKKEKGL
jgi:hypothetical protein